MYNLSVRVSIMVLKYLLLLIMVFACFVFWQSRICFIFICMCIYDIIVLFCIFFGGILIFFSMFDDVSKLV